MIKLFSSILLALSFLSTCTPAAALPAASPIAYNSYATTNVTTSSYVTIVASTVAPFSSLFICDSSGHFLKIAIGAAGSEVDLTGVPYNSCFDVQLGKLISAGSRISVKALDATATSGGIMISGAR